MTGVDRDGALIRNAESLRHLENANTLAVGETETLTEGRPKLRAAINLGTSPRNAASPSRRASNAGAIPPAGAVADGAVDRGAPISTPSDELARAWGIAGCGRVYRVPSTISATVGETRSER